jgi:hypothetical protein
MEAEAKAGHSVEPESDIQSAATATGEATSIANNAFLVLIALEPCFRLLRPPLPPSLGAIL